MTSLSVVGIYSVLLRLYPRRFRDEYGTDMALLLAQQLRDEPTSRVLARVVLDLAITIPTRHLEAHMNQPRNHTVPVLFAALGISGLVLAVIGGSRVGMLCFGLAVAVVAGALAITAWRRTSTVSATRSTTEHWWQILLTGVTVLATAIIVLNVVGEVSEGWWLPTMLILLAGAATTAAGLILGTVHRIEIRHRHMAG